MPRSPIEALVQRKVVWDHIARITSENSLKNANCDPVLAVNVSAAFEHILDLLGDPRQTIEGNHSAVSLHNMYY